MKTLTYVSICFILLFSINACKKGGIPIEQLVAKKTTVEIGQLDSLELINAAVSDSIKWTVTPSGADGFYHKGNQAVVNFSQAGSYTVTATTNGIAYTVAITVTNVIYNPGGSTPKDTVTNTPAMHIPLTGDQITLLSNYSKSTKSDSAYVYFTAQTTNKYACGNSMLNYSHSLDANNNFSINFIDMFQPASNDCQKGSSIITSPAIPFIQSVQTPYLSNGSYPLTVTLNGTTYTGSLVVTATDVTFNWAYTSGVTIVPKHFAR